MESSNTLTIPPKTFALDVGVGDIIVANGEPILEVTAKNQLTTTVLRLSDDTTHLLTRARKLKAAEGIFVTMASRRASALQFHAAHGIQIGVEGRGGLEAFEQAEQTAPSDQDAADRLRLALHKLADALVDYLEDQNNG